MSGRSRKSRKVALIADESDQEYAPGAEGTNDAEDHELTDEDEYTDDDEPVTRGKRGRPSKQATLKETAKRVSQRGKKSSQQQKQRKGRHIIKRDPEDDFDDDDDVGGDDELGGGRNHDVASGGPIQVPPSLMNKAETQIIKFGNDGEEALLRVSATSMTRQGVNQLVRVAVRHVLVANAEHPGAPISRSDLTTSISSALPSTVRTANVTSFIIAIAQQKLAEAFGIAMVEIARAPQRPGQAEGPKHLVLRSLVPTPLHTALVEKRGGQAAKGLLAVVLSLIEMAGGSMGEEHLWRHLGDLGVKRGLAHPIFGVPSALIDEFVKKRLLSVEKVKGNDGIEVTYQMAENAVEQVGGTALQSFYEAEFQ